MAPQPLWAVQRKCDACGSSGETCPKCQQAQRAAESDEDAHDVDTVVNEALSTPSRPLDSQDRRFMESRMGHDFSRVRIHTDERASASARSLQAKAYTVGQDIVFASGRYSPGTNEGRHLLAHELTHVVQQGQSGPSLASRMTVSQPGDPAEQEADSIADAITRHGPMPEIASSAQHAIGRADDRGGGGTPAPTPPAPSPAPAQPQSVCGPNVTAQIQAAVANTRSTFAGWSNPGKHNACQALISLSTGAYAWDIIELHNNAWLLGYRPACATAGATPPCGSTVQVGTDCYYAGSPNYVIFGTMCSVCNAHYASIGDSSNAAKFTQAEMEWWINFYKGTGALGLSTPSGNFGPSRDWAIAGYRGWPSAGAPGGDRNTCQPSCPTPYSGGPFHVNWVPQGIF